jgi:hypothetical protein
MVMLAGIRTDLGRRPSPLEWIFTRLSRILAVPWDGSKRFQGFNLTNL